MQLEWHDFALGYHFVTRPHGSSADASNVTDSLSDL